MLWVLLGVTLLVILATILGTRSPNRLPFADPYDRPRPMEAEDQDTGPGAT